MIVYALRGHERPVRMVKFNRDGDLLMTCSDDGTIAVWRAKTAEMIGKIKCGSAVRCFDISRDTELIVTAEVSAGFGLYDPTTGSRKMIIPVQQLNNARFCEFSFGDKQIATLFEKGRESVLKIYKTEVALKDKDPAVPQIFLDGATQLSWGSLNKYIYVSTTKGSMLKISVASKSVDFRNKVHKDEIISFSFSADRIFLFTCSRDGTYCMLDSETLEVFNNFNFHGNITRAVSISPLYKPDSKPINKYHILVGGGQDEKEVTTSGKQGGFGIKLVNYITSEELAEIKGHFGPVHSLCFAPDGKSFASGSEDGYCRLHFFHSDYFTHKFD